MSTAHSQHLAAAETGKHAALRGEHQAALGHYREAMRLAVSMKAPEVFFRHYLESALESLELMGAFDNVLEYCDRAILHYELNPPAHEVASLDLAWIHQRRGVVLLKSGRRDEARAALAGAVTIAGHIGATLPLARALLGWLTRGLSVSNERIVSEQRRFHYFSGSPASRGALASAGAREIRRT